MSETHALSRLLPNGALIWQELTTVVVSALRQVEALGDSASATHRACAVLADTTFQYADAVVLLADKGFWQPADAILRTCVECEARSDYIIHLDLLIREKEAKDFLQLEKLVAAKSYERIQEASVTGPTADNLPYSIAANWLDQAAMQRMTQYLSQLKAQVSPNKPIKEYLRQRESYWGFSQVDKRIATSAKEKKRPGPLLSPYMKQQ